MKSVVIKSLIAGAALALSQASFAAHHIHGAFQFDGNDKIEAVIAALDSLTPPDAISYDSGTLAFIDKWDVDDGGNENGILEITATEFKDGDEPIAGTWLTDPATDVAVVTAKAGTGFNLWWFEEFLSDGTWTTEGLVNDGGNRPGLSHLTIWYAENEGGGPPAVVPVPAAVWLFGSALIGLAGVARRRNT